MYLQVMFWNFTQVYSFSFLNMCLKNIHLILKNKLQKKKKKSLAAFNEGYKKFSKSINFIIFKISPLLMEIEYTLYLLETLRCSRKDVKQNSAVLRKNLKLS